MRPLVLVRLAHGLQDRHGIGFRRAMTWLATDDEIAFAMRRLFWGLS